MKANSWYWAILVVALSFSFFSCSEDGLSREEAEEIQNVFGDYQVEDIEGLDLSTVKMGFCGDTTFFMGVKDGIMWVAMFDEQTKEQLHVWNSDLLPRLVTEPLEYGEVHEIKPECFDLFSLTRTSWGFAAYIRYETLATEENNWETDYIDADALFLRTESDMLQRFTTEGGINNMVRTNWYQEGVVYSLNRPTSVEKDYMACVPIGGRVFMEDCPYDDDFPTSISTGLRFNDYSRFTIEYINYETGETVWEERAPFLEDIDSDARQTWTVTEQTEWSVDFQVDIVHRNGKREQITFSVSLSQNGGVYQTNID